jgi:inner membrane transporter RhtA
MAALNAARRVASAARGGELGTCRADAARVSRAAGRVPPTALVLLGMVSLQVGATVAKTVFAITGPEGAVALRLFFAAVILLAAGGRQVRIGRKALPVAVAYGLVLAGMNIMFYQAIARIPLGVAVTVEFLGPLTVSLAHRRRWLHAGWALLAAAGVVLLTEGAGSGIDWIGVCFALGAGSAWGCYILLGGALGRRTSGGGGLAIGMAAGAALAVPFGLADAGTALFTPIALLAGLGVALLSSVIPYSLELHALRRIPPRVFGVLMSLEPAVAALAGLVILHQALHAIQWVAICAVVTASIGASREE